MSTGALGEQLLHVQLFAGKRTTDDVVFGEHGDLVLLGARALEGLKILLTDMLCRH